MNQADITVHDRPVVDAARLLSEAEKQAGLAAAAMELPDGRIMTGKTSDLLGALLPSAECIKRTCRYRHEHHVISHRKPSNRSRTENKISRKQNPRLHTDEVLIALSEESNRTASES